MSLSFGKNSIKKRFLTAFLMGVNSGVVYALLGSTLTAYLVDLNVSLTTIGFLSLRNIPYSFKFLWAPFLDKYRLEIPSFKLGLRKSWMLVMQALLIMLIPSLGFIDIKSQLSLFTIVTLLIALLAATYDIAMDAYRIELFKESEALLGNSNVIIGFRCGLIIAAAFALYLAAFISWQIIFVLLGISLIPNMIFIYFSPETKLDLFKVTAKAAIFKDYFLTPMKSLIQLPKWPIIFMLTVFYKLSDGYIDVMLIPFLENIGFYKDQIALYSKTVAIFAGMFGTVIGALLIKNFSICMSLFIAEALSAISNLSFILLISSGQSVLLLSLVSFLESFCSGICNLVLITFMSSLCNKKFTAMHYAILISISSLGRIIISSLAGLIASNTNWNDFFIISTLVSIPCFISLYLLYKSDKK